MYDLIIKNGTIIDGNLSPAYKGDLGIKDGKIKKISREELKGNKIIDAEGLVVAPGFIDMHSHGDFLPLLGEEYKYSRILQGITTEVVGQCGIGPIPYDKEMMAPYKTYVQPIIGDIGEEWNFRDLEGLEKLTKGHMPHNMAYLIGLSALRSYVKGLEAQSLNPGEMKKMFQIYETLLKQGAFGLSLGLSYLPGVFARPEELLGLAEITARHDGIIMAHIRSHGPDMTDAMEEFMELGRKTGAKVHISHCRSYKNKDFGISAGKILNLIDQARARGVKVTIDQHPYTTGSTFLNQLLPPQDRDLSRYCDQQYMEQVERNIKDKNYLLEGWDNLSLMVGFENIYLPDYGKTVAEVAREEGKSDFSALIEILIKEDGKIAMVVREMFDLLEIGTLLKDRETFLGSDGLPSGRPHPRLYGAFPKVIEEHVRKRPDLKLEEAIYKMTGAHIPGIADRGIIEEGRIADLVIFDPDKFSHQESYSGTNTPPVGISKVILGGRVVCDEGSILEEAGMLLKKGRVQ